MAGQRNPHEIRIFFSNEEIETKKMKTENSSLSTASSFKLLLQHQIDFTSFNRFCYRPLEVCVEQLFISNAPLTWTDAHFFTLSYAIPNCYFTSNINIHSERISTMNSIPCKIHLQNLHQSSTNVEIPISILNTGIQQNLERNLFYRLLEMYCDMRFFLDCTLSAATDKVSWGVDPGLEALFTELIMISTLCKRVHINV
jgi:hypothetical protein